MNFDCLIALAGNPNTGKSTIFNALTGLKQHTGNWPGKTVLLKEGSFRHQGCTCRVLDLPGTYSLTASSPEEEVARDFILSGQPDAVVVVADATCLERNLHLVLQVVQLTARVVLCVNLMDEARRRRLQLDLPKLEEELGIPVIPTTATTGEGLEALKDAAIRVALGQLRPRPTPVPQTAGEPATLLYRRAEEIASLVVRGQTRPGADLTARLDRLIISPTWGLFLMLALLAGVFWLTIVGAGYPSQLLAGILFQGESALGRLLQTLGVPAWLHDPLVLGMYRGLAWVISVMLPPMAIFFSPVHAPGGFRPFAPHRLQPGSLLSKIRCPRQAGPDHGHGLWLQRGWHCCRPHHRFTSRASGGHFDQQLRAVQRAPPHADPHGHHNRLRRAARAGGGSRGSRDCARRHGAGCPGHLRGLQASHRHRAPGEPSFFILELPPYRRPRVGTVLVRSFLDRTLAVLWRAVVVAAPCGLLTWVLANVSAGGSTLLARLAGWLNPLGRAMGLDGMILLGFILGLPANEIVVPIIFMGYLSAQALLEVQDLGAIQSILTANGWTWLTALNFLLFAIFHWPCATTLLTIKKEVGSLRWTLLSALLPTVFGLALCTLLTTIVKLWAM